MPRSTERVGVGPKLVKSSIKTLYGNGKPNVNPPKNPPKR